MRWLANLFFILSLRLAGEKESKVQMGFLRFAEKRFAVKWDKRFPSSFARDEKMHKIKYESEISFV